MRPPSPAVLTAWLTMDKAQSQNTEQLASERHVLRLLASWGLLLHFSDKPVDGVKERRQMPWVKGDAG